MEKALRDQFQHGVDVVVDYLWGPSAERLIIAGAKAGREAVPIRFVHVGSVSAANITLPSAALRSSAIELMGSGIGSVPLARLIKSIDQVFRATLPGRFKIATKTIPLSAVEEVWSASGSTPRTVFKIT